MEMDRYIYISILVLNLQRSLWRYYQQCD